MRHSFLLAEGEWTAHGSYWDDQGVEYPVTGKTTIMHLDDKWINKGLMKVLRDNPVEFINEYEISPLEKTKDSTNWNSTNPILGRLTGKFAIVQDMILSLFRSDDGSFSGSECFHRECDTRYQVRGVLFRGNKRLSSWAVTLQKQT